MGLGQYQVSGGSRYRTWRAPGSSTKASSASRWHRLRRQRVLPCGGDTTIYVYLSPGHAGKSTATLAGWHVDDAEQGRRRADRAGVVFERYDEGPIVTDEKGIASFEGGPRSPTSRTRTETPFP
jgi:hypothetical protein